MTRRTKIVATIGPASDDPSVLRRMMEVGLDVVRLNLSHGSVDEHLGRLARVRTAASEVGREIAVIADLPGPKIRAGHFPEGGVMLAPGSLIRLRPGSGQSDAGMITVPYDTLLEDLVPEARVQLGDGGISMRVLEIDDREATAMIETGGRTNGRPGVHLSSETLRLGTPTDEDLVLAETFAAAGVEYVAVSFVRSGADIEKVRAVVGDRAQLVAKVETTASVQHLDEVIAATDAVMVARGDLGIDCPIEDVPHLQKQIIRQCVAVGTPVITATQMLESMISAPSPTRAEVSDVANAVFDGTDALMLSGETAIGRDPVDVVRTMGSVAERAESEASYRRWADRLGLVQRDHERPFELVDSITAAITHAASQAAMDVDADAILCLTHSGRTARAMARFRPRARMIGLSPNPAIVRSMALTWGVEPMHVDTYSTTDEMVWFAVETALQQGLIGHGQIVLVLAGSPTGPDGETNTSVATDVMRIVEVS